jgi:hypothetical protein
MADTDITPASPAERDLEAWAQRCETAFVAAIRGQPIHGLSDREYRRLLTEIALRVVREVPKP